MANVIDINGKVLREFAAPAAFDRDYDDKLHVIYRAVHREFANARAGTASTKKRDEVAGGGRKPWKQKGTGRARQGSIRSPQWRHGGVVFGPRPRSFVESLNKKERKLALLAVLSERFRGGAVTLLDVGDSPISKTREMVALLFGNAKDARKGPATLIVCARDERHGDSLARAGANLARVGFTHDGALDVKDVLRFERLVLTTAAYDALVARLGGEGGGE